MTPKTHTAFGNIYKFPPPKKHNLAKNLQKYNFAQFPKEKKIIQGGLFEESQEISYDIFLGSPGITEKKWKKHWVRETSLDEMRRLHKKALQRKLDC